MNRQLVIIFGLVGLGILIFMTLLLTPQSNPAFDAAVEFIRAAGRGDDAKAMSLLSDDLRFFVAETCPGGRVSTCVDAYLPAEWGSFSSAVFRRALPDGPAAWDVLVIATTTEGQGFSGVCIYTRVENGTDGWKVTRWSGFISCDEANAGLDSLRGDDAPNRRPG